MKPAAVHSGAILCGFVPRFFAFYYKIPKRISRALKRSCFISCTAVFPEYAVIVFCLFKAENLAAVIIRNPPAVFFDKFPCFKIHLGKKPVKVGSGNIDKPRLAPAAIRAHLAGKVQSVFIK